MNTIKDLTCKMPNSSLQTKATLHDGSILTFGRFELFLESGDYAKDLKTQAVSRNESSQIEMLCLSIWANSGSDMSKKLYLELCIKLDKYFETILQDKVLETLR